MIATESISKAKLNKLPENVFRLIGLGQYSLYEVSVPGNAAVLYALRTGAKDIFLLDKHGTPLEKVSTSEFEIRKKVSISDNPVRSAVPNLCF